MFNSKIEWKNEVDNIRKLSSEGETLISIGKQYGVSKQRIKQICIMYKIPTLGIKKRDIDKKIKWKLKWGDKQDTGLYSAQRQKYRNKRANAKVKNIPFDIEFGDIIWNKYCPYFGVEIDYFSENVQENSCSFDRINSALGYVKGNVQICSWRANRIKNDGTAQEHKQIYEVMIANGNS